MPVDTPPSLTQTKVKVTGVRRTVPKLGTEIKKRHNRLNGKELMYVNRIYR